MTVLGAALVWSASASAEGNAANGEKLFKQCKACHAVGPGAKAGVGPEQNNVIGSKAGSRPGYNYSPAMKAAGEKGLVWTEENVSKFLENPKAVVPGTKMIYPAMKKAEDRADVIAFLKTQTGK
ncbi:MAG: cytochrome c family protein [Rhodomicrobium sp.]|nr:cytochrome c family protein [Rhodomicrobium sp.]